MTAGRLWHRWARGGEGRRAGHDGSRPRAVQQSAPGVGRRATVLPQCSPSSASERQIDQETTEGTVRGRIIAVNDATDDEILAWQDLARRAAQPNPLFEVDCLVPAGRHLRNG